MEPWSFRSFLLSLSLSFRPHLTLSLSVYNRAQFVHACTTCTVKMYFFVSRVNHLGWRGELVGVQRHVRGWLNIGSGANTRVNPAT